MAKNSSLARARTKRKRVALLQKGYKWSYVNKRYPLPAKRRYTLYRSPAIRPGTVATTKFINTWQGEVSIKKPAGTLYCPHALLFNPFIGNFVTQESNQIYLSTQIPGLITRNTDLPILPGKDADFVDNYFMNPFANQNFRKMLTMYQEVRVDWVMIQLTPVSSTTNVLTHPIQISHFVDRKYTGKGGGPIDRYTNLMFMDKSAFEQDFAAQGKKWATFDTENRNRNYKLYLQATGIGEKGFIATDTSRYIQNFCSPENDPGQECMFTEFMGFWLDALSPYTYNSAKVQQRDTFTPTIAFMVKAPTAEASDINIRFRYNFKIGYTFRNPGNNNDGTTYDWRTYNWLNVATNHYLKEFFILPPYTSAHDRNPQAQDQNFPIYNPLFGQRGDTMPTDAAPTANADETTQLTRQDTLLIPETPQ
jgi:hypothetical protein